MKFLILTCLKYKIDKIFYPKPPLKFKIKAYYRLLIVYLYTKKTDTIVK